MTEVVEGKKKRSRRDRMNFSTNKNNEKRRIKMLKTNAACQSYVTFSYKVDENTDEPTGFGCICKSVNDREDCHVLPFNNHTWPL